MLTIIDIYATSGHLISTPLIQVERKNFKIDYRDQRTKQNKKKQGNKGTAKRL